ncbi:hypothetical protein I3842_13G114800 [Carya illinoinensis]|uniref:Uncharacterized protein n=1 Tax=Carya illinoinensis TaxID=32201 RepID=A0A922DCB8_CARIL|nr:hypothetical protein I3842_13G114800 [Carya illinoinensis]
MRTNDVRMLPATPSSASHNPDQSRVSPSRRRSSASRSRVSSSRFLVVQLQDSATMFYRKPPQAHGEFLCTLTPHRTSTTTHGSHAEFSSSRRHDQPRTTA